MKETLKKEDVGFAQIKNEILSDKNLSFKAKGLYAYLYSKPNDWDFSGDRIARDSKDGCKSVYATLKELEESGYLVRMKTPSGKVMYVIYHSKKPLSQPIAQKGKQPKGQTAKRGSISNKELILTKNNTSARSQSSRSEISYQPIKEKKPGCPQTYWKNKKRAEIGKQPTYSQNDLLIGIRFYKDEAMRLHGIDFDTLSNPSGKMLKGFKNVAKFEEIKKIISWWLDGGGEYADYTPDAFISESTVNKYKAQTNKKNKIHDDV